jgi:hypothetical protein
VKTIQLHKKIRGEDIFRRHDASLLEIKFLFSNMYQT